MYYLYLLHCADGTLYTGVTTDPVRRLAQHNGEKSGGAKYTAARRPVKLCALWSTDTRAAAQRAEYRVKQLSRENKEKILFSGALPEALSEIGRFTPCSF